MSDLLEMLVATAPMMGKVMQQDIAISISDTEKYIALFETETMKFPFEVGTDIRASGFGEVLDRLARTGESITNYVPKEITGTVPIKSIKSPIIENGTLLGYYSISINIEKEWKIEMASTQLTESIGSANQSVHKMAESAMELDSILESVGQEYVNVQDSITEGSQAIGLIQRISTQSNLLGLNAAIEAARVGAAGKGFAIVASEMRKLAEDSKQIADQVSAALSKLETMMGITSNHVIDAKRIAVSQQASTEMISESMDRIEKQSNDLVFYSKEEL